MADEKIILADRFYEFCYTIFWPNTGVIRILHLTTDVFELQRSFTGITNFRPDHISSTAQTLISTKPISMA